MSGFFIIGEQKVRPGTYLRYWNRGLRPIAGADPGVCASVFRSDWGPLDKPMIFEGHEDIARFYGDGGPNSTTEVPFEQFRGGTRRAIGIRLGSGGTEGNLTLYDDDNISAVNIVMLYPGSRAFFATIRPTLADPDNLSEFLLTDGTEAIERFTFASTDLAGQVDALMEAVAARGSNYFKLVRVATNTGALATVTQTPITPGTDPVINVAAYSRAYEVLESERWNVLSIDTNDTAIHMMTQMFLNRIFQNGAFTFGVIGEPGTGDDAVPFDTRKLHAAAYNDYQMVYVGNGFVDMSGDTHQGYLAAARVAGMIAGTPSNEAITRLGVTNAVDLSEVLRNHQIESALLSGMLLFSRSAANTVWVEQGINTLVLPRGTQDVGWKKIKRAKVRFELFDRIVRTIDPLMGRINNDDDGRMTVIQLGNNVCNAMVAEGKLLPGAYVEIDPDNAPQGDSAWFRVFVDDIDALEKGYYAFGFRFAPL